MLIAVGNLSKAIQAGALASGMDEKSALHFDSVQKAMDFLNANVRLGDILLVKGSRGMKMEQIVDQLLRLEPAVCSK